MSLTIKRSKNELYSFLIIRSIIVFVSDAACSLKSNE